MTSDQRGFTLIELMVTLAILGILAAMALGTFRGFAAKAKQAEAKVNLGAIGELAIAYRSEHDTYVTDLASLGWSPNLVTRYRYWYNGLAALGTPTNPDAGVDYSDIGSAATADSFTAAAVGNVDTDDTNDQWTFNEQRELVNLRNDPFL